MPRYAIVPIGSYIEPRSIEAGRELAAKIAAAGIPVELLEIRCITQHQVFLTETKPDEPTPSADPTLGSD